MPCDGAIEVAADGFVVHMHSTKEQLVPTSTVDSRALSLRERFTLAHEISHTFFYDAARRPSSPQPNRRLLESSCNHGAQRLLLPKHLVEREIGTGRRFDSIEMACDLASAAQVSTEVVLQRLDGIENFKETDYALITLRRQDDGSLVTTGICLNGVFKKLPRPKLYAAPPSWVGKIAPDLLAPTGIVHRSPRNDDWEFVSRCISSTWSRGQVFAEIKLHMRAEKTRGMTI